MMISVLCLGWANLETDTLEQMIISHRRHSFVTIKIVSGSCDMKPWLRRILQFLRNLYQHSKL
ncbi:protein disulfide isomerase4 [Zea mays]|uniref:Protein disulfide isomerase4 n=1 Tax=Zea mays TaxID=4577 RepID=A0A1D6GXN3_MAIZE|nr:protein disulfide isomerase4 [Zea mays]